MFKKIVLFALLFLPLGVFAQEQVKIAYVNTMEVYNLMPETAKMETEMANLSQSLRKELQTMEEEYNKKYSEFMQQQDSLSQSIKVRRMQELQDLRDRLETFAQQAEQDRRKKSEELQAPIVQKLQTAIKTVGEENACTFVMESGAFLYIAPKAVDITPLVKTKLGLK